MRFGIPIGDDRELAIGRAFARRFGSSENGLTVGTRSALPLSSTLPIVGNGASMKLTSFFRSRPLLASSTRMTRPRALPMTLVATTLPLRSLGLVMPLSLRTMYSVE